MNSRRQKRAIRSTDIFEASAVGWATIATLSYRLPMLWLSMFSPTASRRRERTRMISEQVAAVHEGAWAGQLGLAKAFWSPVMTMNAPLATSADIFRAASAPARRKVKANARRLRQRERV